MPARNLPNLALTGGFLPGESGWGDAMSLNLLALSVLVQGNVIDKVVALPGSPTVGDVYILDETATTHANTVAVYDGAALDEEWSYFVPKEGWLLFNKAEDYYEKFDGAVWAELETGGGGGGGVSVVTVVAGATTNLLDTQMGQYLRFTSNSAKSLTVQAEATLPLPVNGEWNIRNAGASDLTIVADTGVTISAPNGGTLVVPTGGTVTLKRAAANVFDLLGQTVAV